MFGLSGRRLLVVQIHWQRRSGSGGDERRRKCPICTEPLDQSNIRKIEIKPMHHNNLKDNLRTVVDRPQYHFDGRTVVPDEERVESNLFSGTEIPEIGRIILAAH